MADQKPDFVASFDDSLDDSEPVMEPTHVDRERNILEKAFRPVNQEAKPDVLEAKPDMPDMPEAKPEDKLHANHAIKHGDTAKLAETIEIQNPKNIFPHIMPYPEFSPKQHHFRFKHRMHASKLEMTIREIDPAFTVQFNEGKDNVDIIIERNGSVVGKLQFLHFDRRDRHNKARHYVKIHFYQFEDVALFQQVIQSVKQFFESMRSQSRSSHKKKHLSHMTRRKHVMRPTHKKKHVRHTRKKPHHK
jgi:hypothetical protein